jgi:ribosomal protein L40E
MSFTGKLNEGVATIASTVKTGVDHCMLEGKILEQQKKIKQLTREIGNLTIFRLDEGEEMSPEIMERYSAIQEARNEIAELEKGKDGDVSLCPKCGAKISAGMKYCGKCGAELSEE